MSEKLHALYENIILLTGAQRKRFEQYYPQKVCNTERNISFTVALLQFVLILVTLGNIKDLLTNPHRRMFFYLYLFLFTVNIVAIFFLPYCVKHEKLKLFTWGRRLLAFFMCLWIFGITMLETGSETGAISVIYYFFPCAAAVVLLFPLESLTIFGLGYIGIMIGNYILNKNTESFFGNCINITFVTILTLFISYRYYRSTAKEFCDREIIENQYAVIEKKNTQLQEMVYVDQLTGLYNRRYFLEKISLAFTESQAQHLEALVIMVDIDYFKKYNDTYGHLGGDMCLKTVSSIFQSVADRQNMSAIRFGGEEFLFVQMAEKIAAVAPIVKEMEDALHLANIPRHDVAENRVTVSIGLWQGKLDALSTIDEAIKYADSALYQAKAFGRNQTVIY